MFILSDVFTTDSEDFKRTITNFKHFNTDSNLKHCKMAASTLTSLKRKHGTMECELYLCIIIMPRFQK